MSRPESYPVAFHRTESEFVDSILQNGILSMKSQGYTLDQIKAGGTGFKFCTDHDETEFVFKSTYVKFGGVETSWSRTDGMNICIDMNILADMGVSWSQDGYGARGDTQVWGDIPPQAIIGAYTDEEVKRMGFRADDDYWGMSDEDYYSPIFELLFETQPMRTNEDGFFNDWWASHWNKD